MSFGLGLSLSLGGPSVIPIVAVNHPNLVTMYTMDNISGSTLVDESSNSFDSTLVNASSVAGKIGNAIDLTGTGSGSYRTLATDYKTQEVSVNFWAKADVLEVATLFSGLPRRAINDARGIAVTLDATGATFGRAGMTVDDAWRFTSTTGTISTGVWYMFTLVANDTDLLLYRDASQIGSVDITGLTIQWSDDPTTGNPDPGQLYIGGDHENHTVPLPPDRDNFNGQVDQFRWFNKVLTQNEIDTLYNGGAGK